MMIDEVLRLVGDAVLDRDPDKATAVWKPASYSMEIPLALTTPAHFTISPSMKSE
ncbi:hypothetical protein SAMN05216304_11468 [Bosea sp. OK403]|nr:hypothetical protein SAMN05216304_11468 [Bosea sp. OK403]